MDSLTYDTDSLRGENVAFLDFLGFEKWGKCMKIETLKTRGEFERVRKNERDNLRE